MYKNRLSHPSQKDKEENVRALGQILDKLGDASELVKIGAATFDGLTKELEIQEHLDAAINRCLKQLLMVRGIKSIAQSASPAKATDRSLGFPAPASCDRGNFFLIQS